MERIVVLSIAETHVVKSISQMIGVLFAKRKFLLARFVATSLGRALTSMAVIFFIREFLASAVKEQTNFGEIVGASFGPGASLWFAAGLLLVTYFVGALFYYDNHVVVQRIIKVIELGFMERVIEHLLKLSVPYADHQSHGEIIQTVRTDVSQMRMVVQAVSRIFLEGVVVVGLMAVAISMSPSLAMWVLIVLPVVSLPVFLVAQRLRARSYVVRTTGYVLFDMILEILKGMRVIKTYHGEEIQTKMGLEKGRAYFDELIAVARLQALGRMGMETLAGLSVVIVVLVGGFQVINGTLDWPSLLAFVMAIRVMHTPLNLMHQQYLQIYEYHASLGRIVEFLETRPEIEDHPDAQPLTSPPDEIVCQDLGFSYGHKDVLSGISLTIRSGETIGIVGPSGAGKTTLLNLLIRLYDPSAGSVQFDGQDLRNLRLNDIYQQVAIVAQEPFLFSTTVRENIRCGRPSATDAEVEDAARAAFIHEDILHFPDGYQTQIGVGGRGLSRGQAQRINVARAFIKNAPILLLDEATSSLDSVAEAHVQEAIEHLLEARTSFVVAHRLSTLGNADRLIVLNQGKCVGFGPHEDLIRDCELYRRLWQSQQLGDSSPRKQLEQKAQGVDQQPTS
ncbi:MAG: ABC transporter ATP-binding protein [Planctomycetales bacterium]|nr:ABC transporter ATP-binding protein [Planctomycetales bacterium]